MASSMRFLSRNRLARSRCLLTSAAIPCGCLCGFLENEAARLRDAVRKPPFATIYRAARPGKTHANSRCGMRHLSHPAPRLPSRFFHLTPAPEALYIYKYNISLAKFLAAFWLFLRLDHRLTQSPVRPLRSSFANSWRWLWRFRWTRTPPPRPRLRSPSSFTPIAPTSPTPAPPPAPPFTTATACPLKLAALSVSPARLCRCTSTRKPP